MRITLKGIKERDENGGYLVYLNGILLSPAKSQRIINHSPDGFAWGYGGSGPAQLALAILLECARRETAIKNYQAFKQAIIAILPKDGFDREIEMDPWLT